jgi:hypothetical protein
MTAHRGEAVVVAFRPPRWAEDGRTGSIEVPAGCPMLIIEGVGAGRSEALHRIDALVWVQSDHPRDLLRPADQRRHRAARRSSAADMAAGPG